MHACISRRSLTKNWLRGWQVFNAVDELHKLLIQEKLGSDGELRTVRRDERIKDNAMLPAAFIDTAGKMLYTKLLEGFEGEMFDAPPPCNSPSDFSSVSLQPQNAYDRIKVEKLPCTTVWWIKLEVKYSQT